MQPYNFQYLLDLNDRDDDSYELKKIIHAVDLSISKAEPNMLFHIVPILYSVAITSGIAVFAYSLIV